MKRLLLLFAILLCSSSNLLAQSFSGSVNIACPPANSNSSATHDLVAPRDGILELTGVFDVTGGLCPEGTTDVTFTMFVEALYSDENGNPTGQTVAATGPFAGTNNPTIQTSSIEQGTLLRVYINMQVGPNGFADAPYTFNYNFPGLTYAQDSEPNNDETQAIEITEGVFYEGHGIMDAPSNNSDDFEDWYKITASSNGTLTVFSNSDGAYAGSNSTFLQIYRSNINGSTQGSFAIIQNGTGGTNSDFNTVVNCVKEGDIIYLKYTGSSNSYRFIYNIAEPAGFMDAEPNDSQPSAISIADGETKTGNLGNGLSFDLNNMSEEDLDDWYTFEMPAAGDIDIQLNTSGSLNTLSSFFFKEDTNGNLVSMPLFGNQTDGYYGTCLPPGTYYFNLNINPDYNSPGQYGSCEDCCITYSVTLNLSNLATTMSDEEPNDQINDAIFIVANTDYEGQLGVISENGTDQQDVYELIMNYNGDLSVNFATPIPAGNSYLQYANDSGSYSLVGTENLDSNGMVTSISYSCAAEGEFYYLTVYSPDCLSYELNYTNTYYGDNNELEPNNTFANAETFEAFDSFFGQLNYGNPQNPDPSDYFELTITESAPLTIDLLLEDNTRINLYENSNLVSTVLQDTNTGPVETFTYNNIDASKTYHIQIVRTDNLCGSYELLGWQQGFASADDTEPNNDTNSAIALDFNQDYEGRLSFYSSNNDPVDYYSFSLSQTDDVELVLNAFEGLSNTAILTLYDSAFSQIFQITHDGINSRTSNIVNLIAGSYFMVISGSSETGSYTTRVTPQNTLSNDTLILETDLVIYPNPTKDILHINLSSIVENAKITLYDLLGKTIISTELMYKDNILDLKHIENGLFIGKIESGNKTIFKRIIKQ